MQDAPIRYRVSMPEPNSHEFHVAIEIPALPERETLDLLFPVWAPGSYLVRDFSRHVYDLDARVHNRRTRCERLDKSRWRIATAGQAVTLRYRVFAFETSVRTSFLDDSHAFGNGTSLFFLVEGEDKRPCLLTIAAPAGWRASVALPALRGEANSYVAQDYDELADSPFEVGTHELFSFRVDQTRFEVALHGSTNIDRVRMLAHLRAITRATGDIFGGFPFTRYLFIIHALPGRGGGLEHAASSTLDIAGFSFDDEKGYQGFAELAAHEFFHAWNVKRIHDQVLGPFDYGKENYTRLLWFHEGFTEYMQSLILLRAGLLTVDGYFKELAEDWTRYNDRPGRNVTPVSELSFEAWIKQYKPAENHLNRVVSYYDKGRWAGLVLDLLLRVATHGKHGVPDLFRRLWVHHGKLGRGIDASTVRREAEAISGHSLAGYFRRHIDGTTELPVPELLRGAGVLARSESPALLERGDAVKAKRLWGWSGLVFAGNGDEAAATVKSVVPDSPAWRAGITFGDELVAIDGIRVHAGSVARRLADGSPGQTLRVSYFRRNHLRETKLTLVRNPERKWIFSLDTEAQPEIRRLRARWLGVTA